MRCVGVRVDIKGALMGLGQGTGVEFSIRWSGWKVYAEHTGLGLSGEAPAQGHAFSLSLEGFRDGNAQSRESQKEAGQ